MKPIFKFIVDKEANFAYWAQLLIGPWSWYFEKDNAKIFSQEAGALSNNERDALEKLKLILQKNGNQYLWLWKRYDNQPFEDAQEEKDYLAVKNALSQKFELFWEKESLVLTVWRKELERYDFEKFTPVFQNIATFLGVSPRENSVIRAKTKLLISGNFPSGATKRGFENLIVLNVSRVPAEKISRAIGVSIHEFMHLISNKGGVMAEITEVVKYPNITVGGGYGWPYLISETILKSISSARANTYFGKLLDFNESEKQIDENLSHKLPLKEYSYEFLIRIAASRLLPETTRYIESEKIMDEAYANIVISVLADLLQEREEGR